MQDEIYIQSLLTVQCLAAHLQQQVCKHLAAFHLDLIILTHSGRRNNTDLPKRQHHGDKHMQSLSDLTASHTHCYGPHPAMLTVDTLHCMQYLFGSYTCHMCTQLCLHSQPEQQYNVGLTRKDSTTGSSSCAPSTSSRSWMTSTSWRGSS